MSGDLVVDYDTLERSKSDLVSIKGVFDGLEGSVSGESHTWGDDRIKDAMHTFATNWGYHRVKLSELIDAGVEKLEKTMDAFKDVDKQSHDVLTNSVKVSKK